MWNRNREYEIHNIHEIGSSTKLYYLWVKGYSTWGERDTIFLYCLLWHLTQTTCGTPSAYYWSGFGRLRKSTFPSDAGTQLTQRAAPVAHKVVWPRPALNLDSLVRRQELNSLLFLKSQPMLPVRDVIHIPWSQFLSGIFIFRINWYLCGLIWASFIEETPFYKCLSCSLPLFGKNNMPSCFAITKMF